MRAVLFDTETTGLPSAPIETQPLDVQPYITQIHAVLIEHDKDGYETVGVFSTFVSGAPFIPAKITELTDITMAKLEGQPTWNKSRGGFFDLVSRADTVCAHNFQFDARMVYIEEMRAGFQRPFAGIKHRCSLQKSRVLNKDAKSHNLGRLYKHLFDEDLAGQHTADADVGGLLRIYMDLVKRDAWSHPGQ